MLKKSNLFLQSAFLCLILIVISGCSGLNENPAGNFDSDRGASDEPVAIIDFPYDLPDEDPIMLDDPVELVQGNYVSFYTWQSDGSLVTNEQYHEEYNELVHPWDDNTLTIDEFLTLYDPNGDIELTCEEPWPGLTVCEPYQVNRNELMNLDDMDPELAALITPEMTIYEAHDVMIAYHRMNGIEDRKGLVDERKCTEETWRIDGPDPPTQNIHMDVCDWVIVSNPYLEFVYDIFGNQYFTHAALVGYCGDDGTAYNGPEHYEWVGGHPDRSGPYGYSDGFIDLWDATVYEAIGICMHGIFRHVEDEVKHYMYSRAFIYPGRDSIQEISFNYSPAVWDDPNWFNIIIGIWEYAWSQNDCRWQFLGVGKEHYGTPAWLGKKPTYCSLLIWQAYRYSTYWNAYNSEAFMIDLDWDGLYYVYPGDLQLTWNGRAAFEWANWRR